MNITGSYIYEIHFLNLQRYNDSGPRIVANIKLETPNSVSWAAKYAGISAEYVKLHYCSFSNNNSVNVIIRFILAITFPVTQKYRLASHFYAMIYAHGAMSRNDLDIRFMTFMTTDLGFCTENPALWVSRNKVCICVTGEESTLG